MTFWAKLLTVIVFVLSIAFAAMSGVVFAKRENYRVQLSDLRNDYDRDVGDRDKRLKAKSDELEQKDKDLKSANDLLDTRQIEIDGLKTDLDDERQAAAEARQDLHAATDNVTRLTALTDDYAEKNKALVAEKDTINRENITLLSNLTKERATVSELERVKADLETERDGLKVELASANEKIRMDEDIFAELSRLNIEARPVIEKITTLPDVRGKVAWVDLENGLVVLNVGRDQGVRKNFFFTVFRDDQFVARVNIVDVHDSKCAGHIVTEKQPVQLGDDAWTRLY